MKLYNLHRGQFLPISIDTAWDFFSNPHNLPKITPPWLELTITNDVADKIHPGVIITYRLETLFSVPTSWVTEITHAEKPFFFVDEMRLGPYRFWHHQHLLHEVPGGVKVEDQVHYALKFGPVGRMLHATVVRAKLEHIFDFRRDALANIFGKS